MSKLTTAMTDFGEKLRQARERRGISLRQIAASTKISAAALEALERNDISKLPGGIFSRSFVRSYAAEVGLDPDETVREFLERFQGEPVDTPAAAVVVPHEEAEFERRRKRHAVVFLLAIAVMIVITAIVGYVVLRNRPTTQTPAEAAQGTALPAAPATDPTTATQRAPETPVLPSAAAAAPERTTTDGGPIRIEIQPTSPCWISAVVDGEKVLARVVAAGERQMLTVKELAVLTVGDAGAFAFTVNGRPGRPLGATGEVKTARISRETLNQYVR